MDLEAYMELWIEDNKRPLNNVQRPLQIKGVMI